MRRFSSSLCALVICSLHSPLFDTFPAAVAERSSDSFVTEGAVQNSTRNTSKAAYFPPTLKATRGAGGTIEYAVNDFNATWDGETYERLPVNRRSWREETQELNSSMQSGLGLSTSSLASPRVGGMSDCEVNSVGECVPEDSCHYVDGRDDGPNKCVPQDLDPAYISDEDWDSLPDQPRSVVYRGGTGMYATPSFGETRSPLVAHEAEEVDLQSSYDPYKWQEGYYAAVPHQSWSEPHERGLQRRSGQPVANSHAINSSESAFNPPERAPAPGDRVDVVGLEGPEWLTWFNGKRGTVLRARTVRDEEQLLVKMDDRVHVNTTVIQELILSPDQVRRWTGMPPPGRLHVSPNSSTNVSGEVNSIAGRKRRVRAGVPRTFQEGDRVRLKDMNRKSLNGRTGKIIGAHWKHSNRWEVLLDKLHADHEIMTVGALNENLEPEEGDLEEPVSISDLDSRLSHGDEVVENGNVSELGLESQSSLGIEDSHGSHNTDEITVPSSLDLEQHRDAVAALRARQQALREEVTGTFRNQGTFEETLMAKLDNQLDDIYTESETSKRLARLTEEMQASEEARQAYIAGGEELPKEEGESQWTTRNNGTQIRPEGWQNPYANYDRPRVFLRKGEPGVEHPGEFPIGIGGSGHEHDHGETFDEEDWESAKQRWRIMDKVRLKNLGNPEFNYHLATILQFDEQTHLVKVELDFSEDGEEVALMVRTRNLYAPGDLTQKYLVPHEEYLLEEDEQDYTGDDVFETARASSLDYDRFFDAVKEYTAYKVDSESVHPSPDILSFEEFDAALKEDMDSDDKSRKFYRVWTDRVQGDNSANGITRSEFKVGLEKGVISEDDFDPSIKRHQRRNRRRDYTGDHEEGINSLWDSRHHVVDDNSKLRAAMRNIWIVGDTAMIQGADNKWGRNGQTVKLLKTRGGSGFAARVDQTGEVIDVFRDDLAPRVSNGQGMDHGQFWAALKDKYKEDSRIIFRNMDPDEDTGFVSAMGFENAIEEGIITPNMFKPGHWSKPFPPVGEIGLEHLRAALGQQYKHLAGKILHKLDADDTGGLSEEEFETAWDSDEELNIDSLFPEFRLDIHSLSPEFKKEHGLDDQSEVDEVFEKIRDNTAIDELPVATDYRKITDEELYAEVAKAGKELRVETKSGEPFALNLSQYIEDHDGEQDNDVLREQWEALPLHLKAEDLPTPLQFDEVTFYDSLKEGWREQYKVFWDGLKNRDGVVTEEDFIEGLQRGEIKRSMFRATDMTRAEAEGDVFRIGDEAFLTNYAGLQSSSDVGEPVTVMKEGPMKGTIIVRMKEGDRDIDVYNYDCLSPKAESPLQLLARVTGGAAHQDEMSFEEFKNSLAPEHRHRAKELFKLIDVDDSGGISKEEIAHAMQTGKLTREHFEKEHWLRNSTNDDKMFNNMMSRTKKKQGEISQSEFYEALHDRLKHLAKEIFQRIDVNRDGSISYPEFLKALHDGIITADDFKVGEYSDEQELFDSIRGEDDEEEVPHGELSIAMFTQIFKPDFKAHARDIFFKLDIDRSGGISREELKRAFRKDIINKKWIKDEFYKGLEGEEGHIGDENRLWGAGRSKNNHSHIHLGFVTGLHDEDLVVPPMEKIAYHSLNDYEDHYKKVLDRIGTNLTRSATKLQGLLNATDAFGQGRRDLTRTLETFKKGGCHFKADLNQKQEHHSQELHHQLNIFKDSPHVLTPEQRKLWLPERPQTPLNLITDVRDFTPEALRDARERLILEKRRRMKNEAERQAAAAKKANTKDAHREQVARRRAMEELPQGAKMAFATEEEHIAAKYYPHVKKEKEFNNVTEVAIAELTQERRMNRDGNFVSWDTFSETRQNHSMDERLEEWRRMKTEARHQWEGQRKILLKEEVRKVNQELSDRLFILGEEALIVGTTRPEINGRHGRVESIDTKTGRYLVKLDGKDVPITVLPDKLQKLPVISQLIDHGTEDLPFDFDVSQLDELGFKPGAPIKILSERGSRDETNAIAYFPSDRGHTIRLLFTTKYKHGPRDQIVSLSMDDQSVQRDLQRDLGDQKFEALKRYRLDVAKAARNAAALDLQRAQQESRRQDRVRVYERREKELEPVVAQTREELSTFQRPFVHRTARIAKQQEDASTLFFSVKISADFNEGDPIAIMSDTDSVGEANVIAGFTHQRSGQLVSLLWPTTRLFPPRSQITTIPMDDDRVNVLQPDKLHQLEAFRRRVHSAQELKEAVAKAKDELLTPDDHLKIQRRNGYPRRQEEMRQVVGKVMSKFEEYHRLKAAQDTIKEGIRRQHAIRQVVNKVVANVEESDARFGPTARARAQAARARAQAARARAQAYQAKEEDLRQDVARPKEQLMAGLPRPFVHQTAVIAEQAPKGTSNVYIGVKMVDLEGNPIIIKDKDTGTQETNAITAVTHRGQGQLVSLLWPTEHPYRSQVSEITTIALDDPEVVNLPREKSEQLETLRRRLLSTQALQRAVKETRDKLWTPEDREKLQRRNDQLRAQLERRKQFAIRQQQMRQVVDKTMSKFEEYHQVKAAQDELRRKALLEEAKQQEKLDALKNELLHVRMKFAREVETKEAERLRRARASRFQENRENVLSADQLLRQDADLQREQIEKKTAFRKKQQEFSQEVVKVRDKFMEEEGRRTREASRQASHPLDSRRALTPSSSSSLTPEKRIQAFAAKVKEVRDRFVRGLVS